MRLQHDGDLPPEILTLLLEELELHADDVYEGAGFAAFSDLLQLYTALDIARLKDPPRPPHAVAELSTHENQRVTKALNDNLQAALLARKQPGPAMNDAQSEAERILRRFR